MVKHHDRIEQLEKLLTVGEVAATASPAPPSPEKPLPKDFHFLVAYNKKRQKEALRRMV